MAQGLLLTYHRGSRAACTPYSTRPRRRWLSRHPPPIPPVPAETARVARTAVSHGTLSLTRRDALGTLCTADEFTALVPRCGQPAEAPWRLALVTIMPDGAAIAARQAAEAVRARIAWTAARSLERTDPGCARTGFSELRPRVVRG